jgi:hypothetical protein
MTDLKYWRSIAALSVAGVFYLAHGLHDPDSVGSLPSLTQEVQAGDVSIISKPNNNNLTLVTTSNDGQTINVWSTTTSNSMPKFVGSVTTKRH